MTKAEFLAGSTFKYRGHFHELGRNPLQLSNDNLKLLDWKAMVEWQLVTNVTDTGFDLFTYAFGLIRISFSECALDKNTPN